MVANGPAHTGPEAKLWSVAARIAEAMREAEIAPHHLLLAIMADVGSQWSVLIDEYGGSTYGEVQDELWKWQRIILPSPKALYGRDAVATYRKRSLWRRVRLWMSFGWRALKSRAERWLGIATVRTESRHAATVRMQAERLAARQDPRGRPLPGHYLAALASVPGPHQHWLNDKQMVISASARLALGAARVGDYCALTFDIPQSMVRLVDRQLYLSSRSPGHGIGLLVARMCWWSVKKAGSVLRVIVIGIVNGLLQVMFLPATVILNSVRCVVAKAGRISAHGTSYRTVLGGEGEVTDADYDSTIAPVLTLLLPRVVMFCVGTLLVQPFLWRAWYGGAWMSGIFVRPDLLAGVEGPIYLTVDAVLSYGVFGALALYVALGALALSLPTHRELEQARLFLANVGGLGWIARISLAPIAFMVHLAESTDAIVGWTGGPFYATLRLIPIVSGALLAVTSGHVLGPWVYGSLL